MVLIAYVAGVATGWLILKRPELVEAFIANVKGWFAKSASSE